MKEIVLLLFLSFLMSDVFAQSTVETVSSKVTTVYAVDAFSPNGCAPGSIIIKLADDTGLWIDHGAENAGAFLSIALTALTTSKNVNVFSNPNALNCGYRKIQQFIIEAN